jgi:hypothetical protein
MAAHVEVDAETGFIRLLDVWVVEDVGTILNPLLVDEQIRGGVVQGIGAALYEECLYDEAGQLLNASLADYLVPMAAEMPARPPPITTQVLGTAGLSAPSPDPRPSSYSSFRGWNEPTRPADAAVATPRPMPVSKKIFLIKSRLSIQKMGNVLKYPAAA